jgi:signal transduction histidine kinase/tetratricopeptide (TPR) repeat protein
MPASDLLDEVENLLGSGGRGDTPMARLAKRAFQRARDTRDAETQALVQYYRLIGQVRLLQEADMLARVDEARGLCAALGIPRGGWLMDDLTAWTRVVHGHHMEAIAICERLNRIPTDARPVFERSITAHHLAFANQYIGNLDEALRWFYRFLQLADEAGRPRWLAAACLELGGFLLEDTLNPEQALPHLQRARKIWRSTSPAPTAFIATAHTIEALDLLGRPQEAYEVFLEDTRAAGAMQMVEASRTRMTIALIGVGRLDEAQAWLDQVQPEYRNIRRHEYPFGPTVRVRLLCAQKRFQEARELAEAERDRVVIHKLAAYDRVQVLDYLREACEALGDTAAAAEAATAAKDACLPLVNLSARARYLASQIELDPSKAPRLSALDLRRLAAIEREVKGHASSSPRPKVPRFLAHVVHELRSPIGGVMGMSSLLLMSELNDKQRRFTTAISSSAATLQRLIDDVLDLSKLESGRFELHPRPFALESWFTQVTGPYVSMGKTKGVEMGISVDPNLPRELDGDVLRIEQVLINLLSNALKFTRAGRVDVRLRHGGPAAPGLTRLRFEVQDTGMGIATDALGRLFQEFVQADETIATDYGGTGLGLALCKHLVELMRGRIGASSEKNVGSLFWFELDLNQVAQPSNAAATSTRN